jgi:hypothetical protein
MSWLSFVALFVYIRSISQIITASSLDLYNTPEISMGERTPCLTYYRRVRGFEANSHFSTEDRLEELDNLKHVFCSSKWTSVVYAAKQIGECRRIESLI